MLTPAPVTYGFKNGMLKSAINVCNHCNCF